MPHHNQALNILPPPTDVEIVDSLCTSGLDTFCLVADSVFSSIDQYISDLHREGKATRWVVPSERSIPAIAVGRWLATGQQTVMMMQNSGFSNAMDYLRTVMMMHRVPGLMLVGWRGHDATLDDSEPHILVGDLTEHDTAGTLGSSHVFGHRDGQGLGEALKLAIADALAGNVACLRVSPQSYAKTHPLRFVGEEAIPYADFAGYRRICKLKGRPFEEVMQEPLLSREDALRKIYSETQHLDPFFIVGNGFNPRAMQALRITENTFENAGGMGSSLAIAWGAAKSNPNQVFVAVDGDQNALMNEMEKVVCSDYPDNLHWYILNNGTGESVGTSLSLPLAPWHFDLAKVINTHNDPPGSFHYPRINATGLKFDSEESKSLAKNIGNLPAEAAIARKILDSKHASHTQAHAQSQQ